jgi:hypothetical protein
MTCCLLFEKEDFYEMVFPPLLPREYSTRRSFCIVPSIEGIEFRSFDRNMLFSVLPYREVIKKHFSSETYIDLNIKS